MIIQGDCVEKMRELDEASVDAICTDPPYHLTFMGRSWDHAPTGAESQRMHQAWATEALRVLKPGGHLLAFGGTRTYHRLACAVEDAGFEIRDSVIWLYGSGFPKSLNVGMAIDKAERGVPQGSTKGDPKKRGRGGLPDRNALGMGGSDGGAVTGLTDDYAERELTSEAALKWEGWGTALKPAHEPIVVARKPLSGTVAANVLEHGTGALNVDGCRIGCDDKTPFPAEGYGRKDTDASYQFAGDPNFNTTGEDANPAGRWPSNVVLSHLPECEQVGVRKVKGDQRETGSGRRPGGFADVGADAGDDEPNAPVYGTETIPAYECAPGCPVAVLDEQSGELHSPGSYTRKAEDTTHWFGGNHHPGETRMDYDKGGGASRFFHQTQSLKGEMVGGMDAECPECGSDDPSWRKPVEDEEGTSQGDCDHSWHRQPEPRFRYQAKASRAERNAGLTGANGEVHRYGAGIGEGHHPEAPSVERNVHPTVKPIDLMRWLVRLVTPPGGTVLDPFAGSGTTGVAAALEGFDFIGIERDESYCEIARARIAHWKKFPVGTATEDVLVSSNREQQIRDVGQLTLGEST